MGPDESKQNESIPRRKNHIWLGLIALTATGLVAWLLLSTPRRGPEPRLAPEGAPARTAPSVSGTKAEGRTGVADVPDSFGQPLAELEAGRHAVAASGALAGTLTGPSGSSIVGATVSVTLFDDALDLQASPPFAAPAESIAARTTEVSTGPGGRFQFPEDTELPAEASLVLWFTHPNFLAQPLVIPPGDHASLEPIEATLESAPTSMTAVVTLDGEPFEAAEILQRPASRLPFDAAPEEGPDPRLCFLRTATSGPEGFAPLAPTDFAQELCAETQLATGTVVSPTWRGLPEPRISLELHASFFVEGTLEGPDGVFQEGYAPTVTFWAEGQAQRILIGTAGPLGEGERRFGPVPLPALPMDGWIARLDAIGVATTELALPAATPGETIQIVLDAQPGHSVRVDVTDAAMNPIPGAWVRLGWEAGSSRVQADCTQIAPESFVASCPKGTIHITAGAPGFATTQQPPAHFPADDPGYWITAQLIPARELTGTCLEDGKPVKDFTVRYWHDVRPEQRGSISIESSLDGSFQIPEAPIGGLSVLALGPDFERSELVTLGPDETTPVTLHLRPTQSAIGRVVDEAGEPIEAATVTLSTAQVSRALDPIGEAVRTAPDGSFQLPGVGLGLNYIQVAAAGYGSVGFSLKGPEEGPLDFGTIPLGRLHELTVRVKAPGDLTSEGPPYLGTLDPAVLPLTELEPDGSTTLDGIAPGEHYFCLKLSQRVSQFKSQSLPSGGASTLEFDLTGDYALTVSLDNDAGKDDSVFIDLRHADPFGVEVDTTFYLTAREPRTLTGFGPGLVKATAQSVDTGYEAKGSLVVQQGETSGELHLAVAALRPLVRIVSPAGAPIAGADIMLYPEGGMGADIFARSGQDGICLLPAVPDNVRFATIYGPARGIAQGLDFTAPPEGSDPVDIVFDPGSKLELTLLVDSAPTSGVQAQLSEFHRKLWLRSPRTSAAQGRATVDRLAPGTYKLSLWGEGIWQRVLEVPVGPTPTSRIVRLHSTTSVTLEVRSAEGGPMANAPVELVHLELHEGPAEWLAEGKLEATPASLTTNSQGTLIIEGLPTGEYAWSLGQAGGTITLDSTPQVHTLIVP